VATKRHKKISYKTKKNRRTRRKAQKTTAFILRVLRFRISHQEAQKAQRKNHFTPNHFVKKLVMISAD